MLNLDVAQDVYLGPATVLEGATAQGRVQLALPSGVALAQSALAMPIALSAGDVVLAIGQADRYYVIGVLHHSGKATFTFPADVEVLAPRGCVRIRAGKRLDAEAPEVAVRAGRIQVVAGVFVQRLGAMLQWVKDLAHLRSGRKNEQVEGISYSKAKRVYVRAENEVKVNGEQIHLG